MRLLFLLACLSLCSWQAMAFGRTGHQQVCLLAYQLAQPATQQRINSLMQFATDYLEHFNQPHVAQACRMISADAAQFPDEARSLWRDGTGTLTLHLAEWIESAIARGQLRHDDPHFMAELLISMIGGQDFDRQRFHMPHRDDAGTRRRWAGFSVDSFLRAFAPAASPQPHSNQLRSFS